MEVRTCEPTEVGHFAPEPGVRGPRRGRARSATLYSTLACPYNFISTFRFNSGSMESIEGLQYLKPQFPVESSEFFDITISNQSRNIAQLERLADKHKTWGGYYSPDVSRMLMKYFPLEDQGMVIIHGPLTADKSSYPAHILACDGSAKQPHVLSLPHRVRAVLTG